MIKKGILSMMAVVIAASAQAQFYGKIGVGVHAPAGSQVLGITSTLTEDEVVKGSFGKGISPVIGVGYMLTNHVGIELAASYLFGATYKASSTSQNASSLYEERAKSLYILPAIVLKAGEPNHKIRPSGRAGLILAPMTNHTVMYSITSGNNKDETTIKYKSKPALGFTGSLGLEFRLNKMAHIWVEAVGSSLTTWLKSAEVTEYKENGADQLPSYTNKTWKFEDKLPSSNNVDQLSKSTPLSSIGLAIGVAFAFGK